MKSAKLALVRSFAAFLGSVVAAQMPTNALAAGLCSEGRTSSGKCVQPFTAAAQRKIMVAFTQPNISQSSKLISSVAAPAQIIASVQNLSAAQSSASTFENLRGPASYEAQTNYSTNIAPSSLSQSQYLTPSEFQSFQSVLRDYYTHHSSGLAQFAASYLKDPAVNLLYFVTPTNGSFGPGAALTRNIYSAGIPRTIFLK